MMAYSLSEFADRVNEIIPVMAKEFGHQINELYKGKITFPQFLILDFLDRGGESKMKDLSRLMGVSTAAITGIIDRIIKYGYVLRVFDPKDRRIIKVRLTPKGQTLVVKINATRRNMIIRVFSKISQAERENYLDILEHVHEILTKEKENNQI